MTESHSSWYRDLNPAKKQAIRQLHAINPYWNLVGLLFILMWVAVGMLMVYFPSPLTWIPGYVLIGLLIHGMANLMHEGVHGTLFKHRQWDRWYGFTMAIPSLFSITSYRVNHLLHHRHNREIDDPDEFTNLTNNRLVLSVFYYVWLLIGMFIYVIRVPSVALVKGTKAERKRIIFEHSLVLLMFTVLVYVAWQNNQLGLILHLWLIPLVIAAFLGNVRGWAEHTRTGRGHPLTETRTITSNRLFSFFNINLNYHLEHHLFPGVPWYNLPKVHKILLEDYKAAGASICPSYTRFLFDAFRSGIHGAPRAANQN